MGTTINVLSRTQEFSDEECFKKVKQLDVNKYLPKWVFESYTSNETSDHCKDFFLSKKGIKYIAEVIREILELAPFLNDADVPLLVGSDNLVLQVSGFSVYAEMQKLQQAGIPAYDVFKAGAVNNARFLKRFATAGTINEGKNAEFVILTQNPLEETSHTESIVGVMLKGQWYDRQASDKM